MKYTSSLEHPTHRKEKQMGYLFRPGFLLWEGSGDLWGLAGSEAPDPLPPWLWRQRFGALEESRKVAWEDFLGWLGVPGKGARGDPPTS